MLSEFPLWKDILSNEPEWLWILEDNNIWYKLIKFPDGWGFYPHSVFWEITFISSWSSK